MENLYGNESTTSVGWQGLLKCLRGPDSSVRDHINLGECIIDNASAHMVVTALASNTSIDSTYYSNHTFGRIWTRPQGYSDYDMPDYILPLLQMNRIKDKSQVARLKIIKYHFYEEGDDSDTAYQIGVFAHMPEIMMPFALEWIGREIFAGLHILENRNHAFTLMYRIVRGMPMLFDLGHGQQQRAGGTKRRRQG